MNPTTSTYARVWLGYRLGWSVLGWVVGWIGLSAGLGHPLGWVVCWVGLSAELGCPGLGCLLGWVVFWVGLSAGLGCLQWLPMSSRPPPSHQITKSPNLSNYPVYDEPKDTHKQHQCESKGDALNPVVGIRESCCIYVIGLNLHRDIMVCLREFCCQAAVGRDHDEPSLRRWTVVRGDDRQICSNKEDEDEVKPFPFLPECKSPALIL